MQEETVHNNTIVLCCVIS